MEMEVRDEVALQVERLSAAALALEEAVERLRGVEMAAGSREAELESRLAAAEATIAELRGAAGRKTLAVGAMMAKETAGPAGIDAALEGLSVEQRIAVKAGMLRAGLV